MTASVAHDLSCVIVHHRSPATLPATLTALTANGVATSRVLIVDNSDDDGASIEAASLPVGIEVLTVPNAGYAAAVNGAIRHLSAEGRLRRFALVATHEAQAAHGAIDLLVDALEHDSRAAGAGPTLRNDANGEVWSAGGYLSRVLKLPAHIRDARSVGQAVVRQWLDGAFVVYRSDALVHHPLSEMYFMYFEETDLHVRLARSGHRMLWVPEAEVSQSSSGIPPLLHARNLLLFHSKFFSLGRGRLAATYTLLKTCVRIALSRRVPLSAIPEFLAGWREGERRVRGGMRGKRSCSLR